MPSFKKYPNNIEMPITKSCQSSVARSNGCKSDFSAGTKKSYLYSNILPFVYLYGIHLQNDQAEGSDPRIVEILERCWKDHCDEKTLNQEVQNF